VYDLIGLDGRWGVLLGVAGGWVGGLGLCLLVLTGVGAFGSVVGELLVVIGM
jgi:hypothetical protein